MTIIKLPNEADIWSSYVDDRNRESRSRTWLFHINDFTEGHFGCDKTPIEKIAECTAWGKRTRQLKSVYV